MTLAAPHTPPASAAPSYRPDIDGLRTIAVMAVLLFHLNPRFLPGGFLGVDVFFVISGYVVSGALLRSQAPGVWAFFTDFYAKRFARILPALSLVLVFSALLACLFIPQSWLSGLSDRTGLFAFWGLSNWVMQNNRDNYFAPRAEFNPYTHTWSLGVEEQFYLIAPLLIYLVVRGRAARPRLGQAALGLVGLACLGSLGWWVAETRPHPETAFYFIGCRFWELGAGVLLRLLPQGLTARREPLRRALRQAGAWLGSLGLLAALVLSTPGDWSWAWNLLAVLSTLLLIAAGGAPDQPWPQRGLSQAAMVWLGQRSYAIYLWHWPVLVLLRWTVGLDRPALYALGVVLTLLGALASYRLVERPLRHHRRLEALAPGWRVLLFLLFPLLGWLLTQSLFEHRARLSLSHVSRHAIDWYATNEMPYGDRSQRNCQVRLSTQPIGGGTAYLYEPHDCKTAVARPRLLSVLGDSHAYAYHPMLEQLSADTGMTVRVYEFAGCPFLDLRAPMQMYRPPGCPEFTRAIVDEVLKTSQAGDFVFMPSLRMNRYGDQWLSFNVPDMHALMYSEGALREREAAVADARTWLEPLASRQLHLIFEAPKPIFKAPAFRCADWFNRHNALCQGDNQQPRAELESLRAPIVAHMQALARQIPGLSIWDPFPILCPGPVCQVMREGRPQFFDGDHPSAYGNWLLYPDFRKTLEALDPAR